MKKRSKKYFRLRRSYTNWITKDLFGRGHGKSRCGQGLPVVSFGCAPAPESVGLKSDYEGIFEGELCNRNGCDGIMSIDKELGGGCSCHINPPCSHCCQNPICNECGAGEDNQP